MATNNRYHTCPKKGCDILVPNTLFCCFEHWTALSTWVQAGIGRTARMNILEPSRRRAILEARIYWGDSLS